jgi:hypothetical protein
MWEEVVGTQPGAGKLLRETWAEEKLLEEDAAHPACTDKGYIAMGRARCIYTVISHYLHVMSKATTGLPEPVSAGKVTGILRVRCHGKARKIKDSVCLVFVL